MLSDKILKSIFLAILVSCSFARATPAAISFVDEFTNNEDDSTQIYALISQAHKENELHRSLTLIEQALAIARKGKYLPEIISALHHAGLINSKQANYQTALALLYEALELAEASNLEAEADLLLNIGIVYDKIADFNNALDCYEKALTIYKKQKDSLKMASIYNNVGLVYFAKEEPKIALNYFKKSVAIKTKLGQPSYRYNYANYGRIYQHLKNYDSAKYYFSKALSITPFKSDSAEIFGFLGHHYFDKKEYKESIDHFKRSIMLATQLGMKDLIETNASLVSQCYVALGEYQDAYNYAVLQKQYADSLYFQNNQKKIAQIEGQYRRAELERLIERKNAVIYISAGASIFIGITLSLIKIFSLKRKKAKDQLREKTAELLGQERERKRISEDLHDGLGGALAGVKLSLLSLDENTILNDKINRIAQKLDEISREVRTIAHNLAPPDFKKYTLTQLLENYLLQFQNNSILALHCEFFPEDELNLLPVNIQSALYRILQELLTNIYKHAKATEVDIQLIKHSGYINLIVEDNGKGFSLESKQFGIGLKNVKSRVEVLKGKLDIDTHHDRGTVINIDLKLSPQN